MVVFSKIYLAIAGENKVVVLSKLLNGCIFVVVMNWSFNVTVSVFSF